MNLHPVDFGPSSFWPQWYSSIVSQIFFFVYPIELIPLKDYISECVGVFLGRCHPVLELFSTLIILSNILIMKRGEELKTNQMLIKLEKKSLFTWTIDVFFYVWFTFRKVIQWFMQTSKLEFSRSVWRGRTCCFVSILKDLYLKRIWEENMPFNKKKNAYMFYLYIEKKYEGWTPDKLFTLKKWF